MDISLFNIIVDVVMITAIVGLWLMWFKQAAQRKKVEAMLMEASEELQEATVLLDKVMRQLSDQQQATETHMGTEERLESVATRDKVSIQSHVQQEKPLQQAAVAPPKAQKTTKQHDGNTQSAQIMRLNREGLSMGAIAEQLNIPVAQVRLMLLLQAPKV